MDQDSEEQPSAPAQDLSQAIPIKEPQSGPSRIRKNKPKVNLIQRNKPKLPPQRKTKPTQSKNLITQIVEEPPPPPSQPQTAKQKTVTPTTTQSTEKPADKPSFFEFIENSEISPHRKKKVDTIDLTDPEDDLPLVRKPKLQELKTPKRKKAAAQSNTITKYLSPPESKSEISKNFDSEEELPGFDFDRSSSAQQAGPAYDFLIIENPPLNKPIEIAHNSEDEIPETFDLSSPIPNLRRTEPTPPPLGSLRATGKCAKKCKKTNPKEPAVPKSAKKSAKVQESGNYSKITKTLHPYLLLATNRKDLENEPEEFKPVELIECKPGSVQCGFCGGVTLLADWVSHLGSHYGIGWKSYEPVEVS